MRIGRFLLWGAAGAFVGALSKSPGAGFALAATAAFLTDGRPTAGMGDAKSDAVSAATAAVNAASSYQLPAPVRTNADAVQALRQIYRSVGGEMPKNAGTARSRARDAAYTWSGRPILNILATARDDARILGGPRTAEVAGRVYAEYAAHARPAAAPRPPARRRSSGSRQPAGEDPIPGGALPDAPSGMAPGWAPGWLAPPGAPSWLVPLGIGVGALMLVGAAAFALRR